MEVMSRYMAHAVVMVSWVHTGTPCRCYRFTSRHRNKASAGEGSWFQYVKNATPVKPNEAKSNKSKCTCTYLQRLIQSHEIHNSFLGVDHTSVKWFLKVLFSFTVHIPNH